MPIKQHLPTKEPAPRRWLGPPRSLPHPRGNPSKGNTRARARACPPPHGTPWGATRHPSPQRGTGTPPLPTRPPAPQTHQRSSGHLRRPTGTGNNTATRPRAPEGRPGMLQGHRQRPGERAHAPGKARGAAATRPAPPWGGAAFETQPRGTGGASAASRRPRHRPRHKARGRGARSGRIPHPCRLPHVTRSGGERARGPASRARRAVPFAMNVRPSSGTA